VPPIRPLETLHNALSLRQLDAFLERMTAAPFRTPPSCASPPKLPRLPNDLQSPSNSSKENFILFLNIRFKIRKKALIYVLVW